MKILIYIEGFDTSNHSIYGSCADIFRQTNYCTLLDDIRSNCKGVVTNTGNRVWFQGIVSELSTKENELTIYDGKESWNEVNERYDAVVFSVANLINPLYLQQIQYLTTEIRQIHIPVYIISIGAQASSYDELKQLCDCVGRATSAFLHAVYDTGGEIACRGYFTKEVFDRICNNTAQVVGCPSLFQNGRNLSLPLEKVPVNALKPVINGQFKCAEDVFQLYKSAIFIDQDKWFHEFYDTQIYSDQSKKSIVSRIINKNGVEESALFFNNRLKVFWDIPEWRNYLLHNQYNYSIGTRIHGTVMSLLSGIPSALCAIDSRTREMGEFYNIPVFYPNSYEHQTFYELYLSTDFNQFNMKFPVLFEAFHGFLKQHHLVSEINQDNQFWNHPSPIMNETLNQRISAVCKYYQNMRFLIALKGRMHMVLNNLFTTKKSNSQKHLD